jgi:hypothetical protein
MRGTNLGSILGGYSKFLIYSWTPNAGHHARRQLNWMMALESGRQSKLNDPCVRDTATVKFQPQLHQPQHRESRRARTPDERTRGVVHSPPLRGNRLTFIIPTGLECAFHQQANVI